MKQKDIALIAVIVFFSGVISLLISNQLFASPKKRQQKVEVVSAISPNFPEPDSKYFNHAAVDPTQLIQIGGTNNPNPFNGTPKQ